MTAKENILGKSQAEIAEMVRIAGKPSYTTGQIIDWLYHKKVRTFDEMSNLSKETRTWLNDNYSLHTGQIVRIQESEDGTKKYLIQVRPDGFIESVYIPDDGRGTLCISTQIGCKMGCIFCMTGKQGYSGDLTSGEILGQVLLLPEREQLTNYVFMGMGEPFSNTESVLKSIEIMTSEYGFGLSPSRITVSTIGIIPGMEEFIKRTRCHLAVSLHTPFEAERLELMPVEKVHPFSKVLDLLRQFRHDRQRRISFEYIMFKGINDTARHVNGLVKLLNGIRCRINLIRYHPIPGVALDSSDEETIQWFKTRLNEKGILTTIRASRGKDIFAACGMLSTASKEDS